MKPGPRNSLTDVEGLLVGNAEDRDVYSGVTVIRPEGHLTAAVDVRGGAPGTREVAALDPTCLVDGIHALVLSGGSAFGLDAASGVMTWLANRGIGFRVGQSVIPIVPSAILYDLSNGGDKEWGVEPPYWHLGIQASDAASRDFEIGNAGAGYGAKAGRIKGGLGSASLVLEDVGVTVAAIVGANPVGSPLVPGTGCFWAAPWEVNGEFGGLGAATPDSLDNLDFDRPSVVGGNTVIAAVATDLALDKAQAERFAMMAHDGISRAVHPAHTPFDGDTVFGLSTGRVNEVVTPELLGRVGNAGAICLTRAIGRAVFEARSLGVFPSWQELYG